MEREYKFPKGCSVQSISMRETTGKDEETALRQAEIKGSPQFYPNELLRLAITKVDGQEVKVGEHLDIESWNSKTRLLAKTAFNRMNSCNDEEVLTFLGADDKSGVSAGS